MKKRGADSVSRRDMMTTALSVVAGVSVLGLARGAHANGDAFFEAQEGEEPEFVYFGSVKDEDGNYIQEAIVSVECSEPQLSYQSPTDVLGRYRSLDIGRVIVELGYKVDPLKIQVNVIKPGYTVTKRMNRGSPRKTKGAFEFNVIVAKTAPGTAQKG